jgi:hypothetical protein
MKKAKNLAFLFVLSVLFTTACKRSLNNDDDTEVVVPIGERETVVIDKNITATTTWAVNKKYLIKGFIYVEEGATLNIEPGTIIKGDKATKGTLIVKPGAKILAIGTKSQPIVFTSSQAKGSRNYGDWGGLIVLGKAKVNKAPATIEGENITTFGGDNNADNSGILKYVRIEFAGIAFETDKEINGLTLGGVGSGTEIDYVQVSHNGDDGFEWFGGAVNAKHLISFKNLDDDFDTDWGYSGKVQYGYIFRDPNVADQCSCSDSNAFESDNDASGSNADPQTSAIFSNVSVIMGEGTPNSKFRSAFRIRRNSAISIYNSVVVGGFNKGGIELEGTAAQGNFTSGKSEFKGLVLAGMTKPIVTGDEAKLKEASRANTFGAEVATLGLAAGYNTVSGKPARLLATGSSLLTGAATAPAGIETTAYKGAFGTTDWTDGWANFDPQNTDY